MKKLREFSKKIKRAKSIRKHRIEKINQYGENLKEKIEKNLEKKGERFGSHVYAPNQVVSRYRTKDRRQVEISSGGSQISPNVGWLTFSILPKNKDGEKGRRVSFIEKDDVRFLFPSEDPFFKERFNKYRVRTANEKDKISAVNLVTSQEVKMVLNKISEEIL